MYSVVGRENVLSVVNGYLDATLEGSGACILLEGSVGIGKSRMLKTVALEGAERGLAVTYMRAGEGDDAQTVRELITFLRHVTCGEVEFHDHEFQNLVRPDANPFLLADSLGEMIEDAARRRPLLIMLDDAQRIDEVSSVALQGMVRSLTSAPVLSLLARRPMPGHSLAQHAIGWLCQHATVHLRLGPLDDEAVAALCAEILGAKPDSSVMAWADRCGGNPWLLETLMGAFMGAGRLAIVDGTASVLAESLPESVIGEISRLLDFVPPGVRQVLLQGGRVGPRFTVEDTASPGDSLADLSSSVDEAVHVGLVRKVGRELAFVHDVVEQAMHHIAPGTEPIEAQRPSPPEQVPQACGCRETAANIIGALGDTPETQRILARALGILAGAGRVDQAGRIVEVLTRAGVEGLPAYPLEAEPNQCGCPSWEWLIRGLTAADHYEEATEAASAIRQTAQAGAEQWRESLWHSHRAEVLLALGRLNEARVTAETGLRLADQAAPALSVPQWAVLARISLHHADTTSAGEHLRIVEHAVGDGAAVDGIRYSWALAQFHAACGRTESAVHTVINTDAEVPADLLLFLEVPTAAATLVRLARKAGLGAEAECAAELARRAGELNPGVASLAGGAEHAHGLLHHDPAALRRAAEFYRRSGRPLATGLALEDAAQLDHDNRDMTHAVELLGHALDLYVQCDARGDIARVQKKLRRLGVQQAGKHGVQKPTSGWESLTSSELRVVRAIVEGKTNKEAASTLFLSPHTVDSHLRRVFGKLGINTRVELTKCFLTHENRPMSIPRQSNSLI